MEPLVKAFGALIIFDRVSRGKSFIDRSFGVVATVQSLDKPSARSTALQPASLRAIAMLDDYMTLYRNGAKGMVHLGRGDTLCGITCITISCVHVLCLLDQAIAIKTGVRVISTHQYTVIRFVTCGMEYGVDICEQYFGASIACLGVKKADEAVKQITSANYFKQVSTFVRNVFKRGGNSLEGQGTNTDFYF